MLATARPMDRQSIAAFAFCWADILLTIDGSGVITFAAGATEPVLGRKSEQLVGNDVASIVAPGDRAALSRALRQGRTGGRTPEIGLKVLSRQGQLPILLAGFCLDRQRGDMRLGLRLGSGEKATEAASVTAKNSDAMREFAENAAANLVMAGEDTPEMSFISLEGLDALRSRLTDAGRAELDGSVKELLERSSLGGETVAVLGSNKFGLVHAPHVSLPEALEHLEDLTRSYDPTGHGAKAEAATVGAVNSGVSDEDLARGLLVAMRQFQDSKGGAVGMRALVSNMDGLIEDAANQLSTLRNTIERGNFQVALQSIVHSQTGQLHHYEALCRFDTAPGESPYQVISFAEQTGMSHLFDLAMAKKVIAWLGQFPRNSDKRQVAVNVSGSSVMSQSYLNGLRRLLAENPWTSGKLMFEITESAHMADLAAANSFIMELRGLGYKVCLDDFGAGSASFQYLSALDVDVVKIDGSAVKNAMASRKGRAFLSALTELCRRMNVETVAEMIDDVATLRFVRDCGCDFVQGYLFGRPNTDYRGLPAPDPTLFRTGR